jgi:hypothetical protein
MTQPARRRRLVLGVETEYDKGEIGGALFESFASHNPDGPYEQTWPWQRDARVHPR